MIDIEQIKSAGDQLRAAWDNYTYVFTALQNHHPQGNTSLAHSFPKELCRQLDTELVFLPLLEPKITQIKTSICRTRNYSSGLAPINSLPPEILVGIFQLVLAQPCDVSSLDSRNKRCRLKYLDHLTQVCTLWRTTAIATRSLWTHIDLSNPEPLCDKLIDRARVNLARVGNLPIELHAEAYIDNVDPEYYYPQLTNFIEAIDRRVETLELVTSGFGNFGRTLLYDLLFYEWSTLTKLVVRTNYSYYDKFISVAGREVEHSDEFRRFELNLTLDELEGAFARLTTLELHGVFPLWWSKAYHGLVDLRLLSTNQWSEIEESEFVTILTSSPGLQILHFGLEIVCSTRDTEKAPSVYLKDLQVVKIINNTDSDQFLCPSSVIRLLAPGTKHLRLCIDGYCGLDDFELNEMERFFTRSRVTRFYTRDTFPPIDILLRHAADLECVVLDGIKSGFEQEQLRLNSGPLPQLRSLHITRSDFSEADLRSFLDCCPDGIVLHACNVDCGSEEGVPIITKKLHDAFPGIRTIDYALYPPENPTAGWDILD